MAKTARNGRAETSNPAETSYESAEQRRAKVPRVSHAGWKAPKGRRDPVELLLETNEGRMANLVPIRSGACPRRRSPSTAAPPR